VILLQFSSAKLASLQARPGNDSAHLTFSDKEKLSNKTLTRLSEQWETTKLINLDGNNEPESYIIN